LKSVRSHGGLRPAIAFYRRHFHRSNCTLQTLRRLPANNATAQLL